MLRNGAKGNWLLEELGWSLHPPGDMESWDGLLGWFVETHASTRTRSKASTCSDGTRQRWLLDAYGRAWSWRGSPRCRLTLVERAGAAHSADPAPPGAYLGAAMKQCSLVAPVLLSIFLSVALFPASASAQAPLYLTQWSMWSPVSIAVDGSGNVYAVDTDNDFIKKFTSNGVLLTRWGTYGSGDGQFDWPYGVAVDASGNVVRGHPRQLPHREVH